MRRLLRLIPLLSMICASPALAVVSINLSGSAQNSTVNLEKSDSHAISANIGLSLGQYASIGLTHRRSYTNNDGLKRGRSSDGTSYVYNPFEERTEAVTNSIDRTLIPYSGLVSPFVFGGVARRDYFNQFDYLNQRITSRQSLYPVPNYGFGLAIQLGGGFQLKLTQTFSPGKETTLQEGVEKEREVRDTYTEIWLGYKI